jgi:hypothetical protein
LHVPLHTLVPSGVSGVLSEIGSSNRPGVFLDDGARDPGTGGVVDDESASINFVDVGGTSIDGGGTTSPSSGDIKDGGRFLGPLVLTEPVVASDERSILTAVSAVDVDTAGVVGETRALEGPQLGTTRGLEVAAAGPTSGLVGTGGIGTSEIPGKGRLTISLSFFVTSEDLDGPRDAQASRVSWVGPETGGTEEPLRRGGFLPPPPGEPQLPVLVIGLGKLFLIFFLFHV